MRIPHRTFPFWGEVLICSNIVLMCWWLCWCVDVLVIVLMTVLIWMRWCRCGVDVDEVKHQYINTATHQHSHQHICVLNWVMVWLSVYECMADCGYCSVAKARTKKLNQNMSEKKWNPTTCRPWKTEHIDWWNRKVLGQRDFRGEILHV
jgi:hypothetical protein